MPIRINLKELFSADSQSTVIDKINFNFNKLLELGIGDQGERGLSGLQGAAGPFGLKGDQGTRGATWYVDSATDPNTLSFQDILEGDLYLDSNNLSIWQYDGTQWNFVVDITNVINNYLTSSPSPFRRGFGIGTPNDDRFILFNRRDDINDLTLGLNGSSSENDILFLNNYDEDAITPFIYGPADSPTGSQTDTNNYYNALLSISVDHRSVSTGRYHLELGSLYLDGSSVPKLSSTYENLKVRFIREDSATHTGQDHYNLALFSLDTPEIFPASRVANGVFQFAIPKYLPTVENSSFNIYLGSKYGLDEVILEPTGYIKSDGFLLSSGNSFANIGLIEGHLIPNYPSDNGYIENTANNAYLWMESIDADATMIDDVLLQNGGNIIQLGTTSPRIKDATSSVKGASNSSDFYASGAITILGNEVYTAFGNTNIYNGTNTDLQKFGYFNKFSIANPNSPTSDFTTSVVNYIKFDGRVASPSGSPGCNEIYTNDSPIGPGIKDMVSDGDYIFAVNSLRYDKNPGSSTPTTGVTLKHTAFQILKKNSKNGIGLERISRLGLDSYSGGDATLSQINGASRVKLFGKYAIISTNTLQGWNTPLNLSDTILDSYDGRLTAIDVTDPENPRIDATCITSKFLSVASSTAAILDIDIFDDYAFTVTWEQEDSVGTTAALQIRADVFDLRGLKHDDPSSSGTISWVGRGNSILNTTGYNTSQINSLAKTAAISTDGKYVYVGYNQTVYVYDFNVSSRSAKGGDCYLGLGPAIKTFTISKDVAYKIVDLKAIGNSVYVLLSSTTASSFVKIDAASTLTQIYDQDIAYPASRFENSGKHIYIACQNSGASEDNAISLITLDFDGIYTSGAHIESLRTDDLSITKDLKAGGSVNIGGSLIASSGALIHGHLGVEKGIQTPYIVNDEGELTIKTVNSGANGNINIIAKNSINITAVDDDIQLQSKDDIKLYATGSNLSIVDVQATLDRPINPGSGTHDFPYIAFNVEGWVTPIAGEAQFRNTVGKQLPAFASGIFTKTKTGTTLGFKQYWIKTGSVVQVTGIIEYATNNPLIPAITLDSYIDIPLIDATYPITESSANFYGHGTWEYNGAMYPVELRASTINNNQFFARRIPTVSSADRDISTDTDMITKGYLRFTYTYTLDY